MKTITMMQLRKSPGEYAHLVYKHGESFLVTNQGRPIFQMVPVKSKPTIAELETLLAEEPDQTTIIQSDGTCVGSKPLTFRQNLGGEYGDRDRFSRSEPKGPALPPQDLSKTDL